MNVDLTDGPIGHVLDKGPGPGVPDLGKDITTDMILKAVEVTP